MEDTTHTQQAEEGAVKEEEEEEDDAIDLAVSGGSRDLIVFLSCPANKTR